MDHEVIYKTQIRIRAGCILLSLFLKNMVTFVKMGQTSSSLFPNALIERVFYNTTDNITDISDIIR